MYGLLSEEIKMEFNVVFLLSMIVILLMAIVVILLAYPGPKRTRSRK